MIEMIMDKLLLPNNHFQAYINRRYQLRKGYTIIYDEFLKDLYFKYNGFEFAVNDQLESILQVNEYRFSDIRSTDIVLDIGANIGAFTLMVARKANHVFAVEPLFGDILRKNVTIIEAALGDKGNKNIKYGKREMIVEMIPLREIIQLCGHKVDFLKCDCEGGEWSILPDDIKGIRRIEAEIHHFKNMPDLIKFEDVLKKAGFGYEKELLTIRNMIIHAQVSNEKV